jgi:hypothetical protein
LVPRSRFCRLEHQAAHLPALSQIKDQVKTALKKSLASKKAEAEADRLLGELRGGKPLAQVAAGAGLTVQNSGFFTRLQGFKKQREAEALTGAAFKLSRQQPYPEKPLWCGLLSLPLKRREPTLRSKKETGYRRFSTEAATPFASWLDRSAAGEIKGVCGGMARAFL